MSGRCFPKGFLFGTATSSYQIEGGWPDASRGESIWDRFSHRPGAISDGATGDTACDHLKRWTEDIDWMKKLGADAYRFSISWPRILPLGRGKISHDGLGFYSRLVDGLLEAGIRPFATLYHWDLPQVLQDGGGWTNRTTVDAFCEYTEAVARTLGDRIKDWITLNEPFVSAVLGYETGEHAPGHQDEAEAIQATHHLLLAHGRSVPILRSHSSGSSVGITNVYSPIYAASQSEPDRAAAAEFDMLLNRLYTDPLLGREYPPLSSPDARQALEGAIRPGDLEEIAAPLDFLGVNYYTRHVIRSDRVPDSVNQPQTVFRRAEETQMGWEVYPEGLHEVLDRLHRESEFSAYYVTENGAAYPDVLDLQGGIEDPARIAYFERHMEQVLRILDVGIPLAGYFAWSLLDNFEWAFGFSRRFGLIHVDFGTGVRTPKASFEWYRRLIALRRLP